MTDTDKPVMVFSEEGKQLCIHVGKRLSDVIDITILNKRSETVARMKLISGSHRIDLSSLIEKEYAVRLVAGSNVWVQKIIRGSQESKVNNQ